MTRNRMSGGGPWSARGYLPSNGPRVVLLFGGPRHGEVQECPPMVNLGGAPLPFTGSYPRTIVVMQGNPMAYPGDVQAIGEYRPADPAQWHKGALVYVWHGPQVEHRQGVGVPWPPDSLPEDLGV